MTRVIVLLLSFALPVFPVTQAWASCCPFWGDDARATDFAETTADTPPCHGQMNMSNATSHGNDAAPDEPGAVSSAWIDHAQADSGCCHAAAGLPNTVVAMATDDDRMAPVLAAEQRHPEPGPAQLLRPPSIG